MAEVDLTLVADTREAQAQYGSEMPDAIQRMADALDDVERQGEDAAESLESGFRDILDGAGDASDGISEVADEGQNASVSVRAIGSTAKQALEGDLAGAANAAVGLLRGFGPAGVIAGTAAAAGIGLITTALNDGSAAAADMQAAITAAYQRAAEDGRTFLTEAEITATALDVLFDPAKREDARAEAERIQVDLSTYVRAQAGDQEALNQVLAQTNALIRERRDELKNLPGDIQSGATAEQTDQTLYALNQILGENQAILDTTRQNQAAAQDYADVVKAGTDNFVAMRDVISEIPETKTVKVDADTTELGRKIDAELGKKRVLTLTPRAGSLVP